MDRIIEMGSKGSPAIRSGGPQPTSHLLVVRDHVFVIDCGSALLADLSRLGFI